MSKIKKTTTIKLIVLAFCIALCSSYLVGASTTFKNKEAYLEEAGKIVQEISPREAFQEIQNNSDIFIIDTRLKTEYDKLYIKNSVLIPRGMIEFKITNNDLFPEINNGKIPRENQPILTYCKLGGRGLLAAKTLKEMGFNNVRNIKGGLKAWMKEKLPLEK